MKKLFAIRDTRTNKILPQLHFSSKGDAKAARDALNISAAEQQFVVTPGPDHWKQHV